MENIPRENSHNSSTTIVLIGLLAAAVLAAAFYFWASNNEKHRSDTSPIPAKSDLKEKESIPQVLFSGIRTASPEDQRNFIFDTDTNIVSEVLGYEGTTWGIEVRPTNHSQVAFVRYFRPFEEGGRPQLTLATLSGEQNSEHEQLTELTSRTMTNLEWSADGQHIVYNTGDVDDGTLVSDPEAWHIYVYSVANGSNLKLGSGANPQLSPDGSKVLFTRQDGIYMMDIASRAAIKVDAGSDFNTFNRIALSNAGDQLVWTNHIRGYAALYDVDWEGMSLDFIERINMSPATVDFSPHDRYLVYHKTVFAKDADGEVIVPPIMTDQALSAYDLLKKEEVDLYPLEEFIPDFVSLGSAI